MTKVTMLQGIRKPSARAGLSGNERLASPTREAKQELQDNRSLHAVPPLHIAGMFWHGSFIPSVLISFCFVPSPIPTSQKETLTAAMP